MASGPTRRNVLAGSTLAGAIGLLGATRSVAGTVASTVGSGAPPKAPRAEWVYDAVALLQKEIPHGRTIRGERFRVPIIGGSFAGPTLRGEIVAGGYDWQLVRSDGYWEIAAEYFMQTHDGVQIHIRNYGLWHSKTGDWPADYAVTTPQFEAPDGPYSWLNRYVFTGTINPAGTADAPAVKLSIFKLVVD